MLTIRNLLNRRLCLSNYMPGINRGRGFISSGALARHGTHDNESHDQEQPTNARSSPPSNSQKGSSKSGINDNNEEEEPEMVELWQEGPSGPEWSGPRGYEPTRYGDWSQNGRVSDF